MNCEILETLYIKANGTIQCNDDAGEALCLDYVNKDWSPDKLFSSTPFKQIRSSFLKNKMPWAGICENCAFISPTDTMVDRVKDRIITKLQIEPSLVCNLKCPACCNQVQIKYAPKPLIMSLGTFTTILEALCIEGYEVQEIEYCGQGEPLMNRKLPEFIKIARQIFPNAKQRLITNGNGDYERSLERQKIDQIFVSCDGFYQNNYKKYRVNGDVRLALEFMRAACMENVPNRAEVIWKYILFKYNDSEEELIAAQNAAQEIGVNTLLFIFTHSQFASKRYQTSNYVELPRLYDNVATSFTPITINRFLNLGQGIQERRIPYCINNRLQQCDRRLILAVDEVAIIDCRYLNMRGWVLCAEPIFKITLYANGEFIGTADMGMPRIDVARAYPGYKEPNSGFIVCKTLTRLNSKFVEFTLEIIMISGALERMSFEYKFYDSSQIRIESIKFL